MNKKTVVISLSIIISLTVLAFFIHSGYDKIAQVVAHAKHRYIFYALLAAGLTYTFMGLSLHEVLRLLGFRLNHGAAISIAFVSTAVNYFVSSMGVSGFALRAHLLKKRNIPFAASVTASVVITVLLYLTLAVMILQGSIFLIIRSNGAKMPVLEGFVGVVLVLGICMAFGMAFFDHEFRSKWINKLFHWIDKIIFYFSGGQIPREDFQRFESQLTSGIKTIHEKKYKLTRALIYICCDWLCTLLVLHLGFMAVGEIVPMGELVAGFSIGMVTTLIPILPGGLGAMELAMTAAYANFGIPWHNAIVACLIYRVSYYIIPALFSVFVYWGLKISEPLDLTEDNKEIDKIIKGESSSETITEDLGTGGA